MTGNKNALRDELDVIFSIDNQSPKVDDRRRNQLQPDIWMLYFGGEPGPESSQVRDGLHSCVACLNNMKTLGESWFRSRCELLHILIVDRKSR